MSELYTFLDGAFADIRSKLDLEYQRRLTAHEARISEELSAEDYTPDYGKIDVAAILTSAKIPCKVRTHNGVWQLTSIVCPPGRWFIHIMNRIGHHNSSQLGGSGAITIIDNYGEFHNYDIVRDPGMERGSPGLNVGHTQQSQITYKYRLPNIVIDICKTLGLNPCIGIVWGRETVTNPHQVPKDIGNEVKPWIFQLLAEHYYKRFTAMRPLFTSGRFADYAALQAELEDLRAQLTAEKAAHAATTAQTAEHATVQTAKLAASAVDIEALKAELVTVKATLSTTTAAYESQTSKIKGLAKYWKVPDDIEDKLQYIRDEDKKLMTVYRQTVESLTTAEKQIERLRAENQNYVDQVFAQRQEITGYKKQLLESPPSEPVVRSDLEEQVTQLVAKALAATTNLTQTPDLITHDS